MGAIPFFLASASPRRLELLRQLGLDPHRVPTAVDEALRDGEPPSHMVRRLAEAKARDAAARIEPGPPSLVLGADTAVVLDDVVLGKPRDAAEATGMLGALRGRTHEVLTGVFLMRTDAPRAMAETVTSRVRFRAFDDATLEAYVATGEPMDKAGAYGVQGCAAVLVESVEGSFTNVVGLPIERLPVWLGRLGVDPRRVVPWLADPTG